MHSRGGNASPFSTYRGRVAITIVVLFTILSSLALLVRFISKRKEKEKISAVDGSIVLAQLFVYGLAATCMVLVVRVHKETTEEASPALKAFLAMQVIYPVSLSFTMISVSLYYQRTIPYRKINSVSYTMIACSCAYAACSTFYELLICRPLSSYWTMSEVCSKHSHAPYVVFGVFSVVMMTTLLALPFPWLGRARLGIMDRIGSGCILAVGLCIIVSSSLRTKTLLTVSVNELAKSSTEYLVWSFMGPALAVLISCAPFLRLVYQKKDTSRTPGIELRPYSLEFHRLRETVMNEQPQGNPIRRTGTGVGLKGEYLFTQVIESGHWSATSDFDH